MIKMIKKYKKSALILIFTVLLISASLTGCEPDAEDSIEPEDSGEAIISVGSKDTAEQLLLGQIAVLLLEDAGFRVEDNTGWGGNIEVREALEEGEIDLYWEYTGTAWVEHLGHDKLITDPQKVYEAVKEEDLERNEIVWLDYTPFSNTYSIMMRKSDAQELGIETISDLAEAINEGEKPLGDWVFASSYEYFLRPDGLAGLQEYYSFEFDDIAIMDEEIICVKLSEGEYPAAMGFATDGRIAELNLVVLKDDLKYHPAYNCAVTIHQQLLEQHPEIEEILNQVVPLLDDETMSTLNASVDIDGNEPDEVAREFLLEKGLIE